MCLLCQEEQFCLYSKMSDPELLNSGAFCLLEQRPTEVGDVWKLSILQFVAVGVGCLALGYWVGKKRGSLRHLPPYLEKPKYHGKEQTHDVEKLAEKFEDFKMVSSQLYIPGLGLGFRVWCTFAFRKKFEFRLPFPW